MWNQCSHATQTPAKGSALGSTSITWWLGPYNIRSPEIDLQKTVASYRSLNCAVRCVPLAAVLPTRIPFMLRFQYEDLAHIINHQCAHGKSSRERPSFHMRSIFAIFHVMYMLRNDDKKDSPPTIAASSSNMSTLLIPGSLCLTSLMRL
jgi:hypothetical protein